MAVTIGNGDLSYGGAVVETSGGVKYAIIHDPGDIRIEVWKNIDGTPSMEGAWADIGHAFIGAAIDTDDKIHIISAQDNVARVEYRVWLTSTDAWEASEVTAASYTNGVPLNPGCAITIDSSDYPHILYVDAVAYHGTPYDQIYHAWNDGSWNTEVVCGTANNNYSQPRITCCPADDLEAFYYHDTTGDPTYNRKNAGWAGEAAYTETDAAVGAVVCTTGDTVYRYHADTDEDIEENNVDTTYNTDATQSRVSAALVGTDRYIFYIDTGDDVHLISNDGGGWTDKGDLQAGTYDFVIAEWAYLNEHQSGEINYIFDDGTNVYYDSFSLAPPPTGQPALLRTWGIPTGPGGRMRGF